MEKEIRELYTLSGEPTGIPYTAGDKIPDGYCDMVVMLAIVNNKNKFLMQKRSKQKGGGWAVTGGHPKFGESGLTGVIAEVTEELSIDISNCPITKFAAFYDGKHFREMFVVNHNFKLKDVTLQKSEVEKVKWFSEQKLLKLIKQNKISNNQIVFYTKLFEFLNK